MTELKNEMTTLQSLGAELDPPVGGPSADLRRQVMSATRRRRAFRLNASRGAVPGWRPAIAVGLAAAVAVGMWAAPIGNRTGRTPSTTVASGPVFVQPVNAAAVLHNAAVAAKQGPDQAPRPDQWVFSESRTSGSVSPPLPVSIRQTWTPADGSHAVVYRERPASGGSWQEESATGGPQGAPADLPTTAKEMLTYLQPAGTATPIWKAAGLIADSYWPAASRAALWEALATLPDARVDKGVTDATGRQGIAVGPDPGAMQYIFDAKTYDLLALRWADESGKVSYEDTFLRLAVVDNVRQLP